MINNILRPFAVLIRWPLFVDSFIHRKIPIEYRINYMDSLMDLNMFDLQTPTYLRVMFNY